MEEPGRRFAAADVALHDLDRGDGAIAVELVDPVDDLGRLMLEVEAAAGHRPDHQGSALLASSPAPRGHLMRSGSHCGQRLADDRRPLREEVGIGKTIARKGGAGEVAEVFVEGCMSREEGT